MRLLILVKVWPLILAAAFTTLRCPAVAVALPNALQPVAPDAKTQLVERYLRDLERAMYDDAFGLLNARARTYIRDARNLRSIYAADAYQIHTFKLLGKRSGRYGDVYFVRETAAFLDHAHDAVLTLTGTVPLGVIREGTRWRIKDPGHPWRAFQPLPPAGMSTAGLRASIKKVSFFTRRIEVVVTFTNFGASFVTLLPYDKSVLRDGNGHIYPIIETRDWSLTDKQLFEGLRLAPRARYTGTLAFTCPPLDNTRRTFALTVGPLLVDGAATPVALEIGGITDSTAAALDQR